MQAKAKLSVVPSVLCLLRKKEKQGKGKGGGGERETLGARVAGFIGGPGGVEGSW